MLERDPELRFRVAVLTLFDQGPALDNHCCGTFSGDTLANF